MDSVYPPPIPCPRPLVTKTENFAKISCQILSLYVGDQNTFRVMILPLQRWARKNLAEYTYIALKPSSDFHVYNTRKYPLRGYILGVLMHTTAWDQLWGGNFFNNCKYIARLRLAWQHPNWASGTLTMWF